MIGLIIAWLVFGALTVLLVIALMRECSYPPTYVWAAFGAILLSLFPGLWVASRQRSSWYTVVAVASLMTPPIVAWLLSGMCVLAWL